MYKLNCNKALVASLPIFVISPLFMSPVALAETPSSELDEIVVTANRVARTVDETLVPVTIITSEDIARTQATELSEVLRKVPGLNVANNGGVGKVTSVFMRGTNSGHVLVLVDGVKHGSATLGTTSFQHFPVDQIERIEVVRGPRSSLYGSEAIGGVIQIFTKKGTQGFKPSVTLSAGSNDSFEATANLSGGNKKAWYNLNLQALDTAGIDACNSSTAGCFADEPDKDGYQRNAVALNTGYKFNESVSAEFSTLHAEGDTEFDGGFSNQADFVQQVLSAKLVADINDNLSLQLGVGQSRDKSDNFKDGVASGTFNTKRINASFLADMEFGSNQNLILGLDWNDDKVDSTTDYSVTSRDNSGVFANYSTQLSKTLLDLSVRYDDNEQFGTQTTGGIALGQKLNDTLTVKASYATAFKAPTFNQLYFPGFGLATLKPEESKNYELGLSGQLSQGNWELNLFENQIDNLIAGFPVSNIDEAQIRGVEAAYTAQLGAHTVSTNFTLQKPENRSGANKGKLLRERPRKIVNIDVDRPLGRFNIGVSLHAESERFTNADNSNKLGGFSTLDLRTDYALSKNWSVGLKVANVLDKQYSTKEGYNQDGVNGMLSIRYTP